MVFGTIFEQFVQSAPICVMNRALLENIFAPEKLDAVFERAAEQQYHRELLFSTLVDLMGFVVTRRANSVHAAYVDQRGPDSGVRLARSMTNSVTSRETRREPLGPATWPVRLAN